MNYYRLSWLGIRIACISGALWLALRQLRPKPSSKRVEPRSSGVLGVYVDDLDRFIISLATSRFDNTLLGKGRLLRNGDGSVVVQPWDSSSKDSESPVHLWTMIRREGKESDIVQAFEAIFSFAQEVLPVNHTQSPPLYSSLILPFNLSYTQRELALSLANSAGHFKRTFGVHFHDLIRPLEGPCKLEYGNHPSLVLNPDGSSFIIAHSDRSCLHIRTDDRESSSDPFALLSSYSNITLEDVISIDNHLLTESTLSPTPSVTPPIRGLSLDTIVQRAPILAAANAVQPASRRADPSIEDDLQPFFRWHIPLNRDPVLVSLPTSDTSSSSTPHRFLDGWQKASHTKFTTSPGQTSVKLDFYAVSRSQESWPPIPGSSRLFATLGLDGLPVEGGSEVLLWYDGFHVQAVNPPTGRRAYTFIGPQTFDEVRWGSRHASNIVG